MHLGTLTRPAGASVAPGLVPAFAAAVASVLTLLFLTPAAARAQDPGLKIAAGDVGIGIGDVPRLDGLRVNFRDRHLELVRGINVTFWEPHDEAEGVVEGLALGVPLTGAGTIRGVALGAGVSADDTFSGLGVGALGLGSGGDLRGIGVGGLGIGSGGNAEGVVIGGLGAGAGGNVTGIFVGGLGAGAGGTVTGLAIGGLGVGAGGEIRGIALAGVGVGAPRITGVALSALMVGTEDLRGLAVAPIHVRVSEDGRHRGVSVSAFNRVDGTQTGITIGLLNIARELHGLQVGLVNIAWNKDRFPVLPLVNYHR